MRIHVAVVFVVVTALASGQAVAGILSGAMAVQAREAAYKLGVKHAGAGDWKKAIVQFTRAADLGHPDAHYVVASHFSDIGEYEQSLVWAIKGFKAGHASSAYLLGIIHEFGHGVTEDIEDALVFYLSAAIGGDSRSVDRLASRLDTIKSLAGEGSPRCELVLGMMTAGGLGIDKDLPEGIRLIRLAAKHGSQEAQSLLASLPPEEAPPPPPEPPIPDYSDEIESVKAQIANADSEYQTAMYTIQSMAYMAGNPYADMTPLFQAQTAAAQATTRAFQLKLTLSDLESKQAAANEKRRQRQRSGSSGQSGGSGGSGNYVAPSVPYTPPFNPYPMVVPYSAPSGRSATMDYACQSCQRDVADSCAQANNPAMPDSSRAIFAKMCARGCYSVCH